MATESGGHDHEPEPIDTLAVYMLCELVMEDLGRSVSQVIETLDELQKVSDQWSGVSEIAEGVQHWDTCIRRIPDCTDRESLLDVLGDALWRGPDPSHYRIVQLLSKGFVHCALNHFVEEIGMTSSTPERATQFALGLTVDEEWKALLEESGERIGLRWDGNTEKVEGMEEVGRDTLT